MWKKVTLCNSEGKSLCGSDGHIHSPGRFYLNTTRFIAARYRERFREHFAWKAEYWTHFYFDSQPGKMYSID